MFKDFRNRIRELDLLALEKLIASPSPYTLIAAPAGYGKSWFLQHFIENNTPTNQEDQHSKKQPIQNYQKTHWIKYINFETTSNNQINYIVYSLGITEDIDDSSIDKICNYIINLKPNSSNNYPTILLIFDSVERLKQDTKEWLFHLLAHLYKRTHHRNKETTIIRIIFAGRDPMIFWQEYKEYIESTLSYRIFDPQKLELEPFKKVTIESWILELARDKPDRRWLINEQDIVDFTKEILYLSGGHPEVVHVLINRLNDENFSVSNKYFTQNREQLVKEYLAPAAEKFLQGLPPNLRQAYQTLSVFRRLDSDTILALSSTTTLPSDQNEAFSIINELQRLYLLTHGNRKEPFPRHYMMRQVVAMVMANTPGQENKYKKLNKTARDLYDNWIREDFFQNEYIKSTQRLLCIVEWLFHALQDESLGIEDILATLREYQTLCNKPMSTDTIQLLLEEIKEDEEILYLLDQRVGKEGIEHLRPLVNLDSLP